MAIEGPVRELALSDLLQLLFLSRKTGVLAVRDESTGRGVTLELENGALAGATSTNAEARLGRLLVGSGRATDAQVARALAAQRERPRLRLGEILSEMRAVRTAEVVRHLRLQVEEAVFDLMRWKDGHVRFEERAPDRERRIQVRLATDAVLMDAARRLDEWAEVTAQAPDPDPVPRLAAAASAAGPPLALNPREWEVLAKVDGATSIRRIALSLGRGELEIARAVYSLVSTGVVEVGSRPDSDGERGREEIEREIRTIESELAEGRVEDADRRARRLLDQRPNAAGLHVLRSRVLARKRDWAGALRAVERAIELDPLLASAYFHLARAAVRTGELDRAREALATYRKLPDSSPARRAAADRLESGLAELADALEVTIE